MRQTIQVQVEDKQGVLMRVTGIISAKGANIHALTLTPDASEKGVSTIMIVADLEPHLHQRVVNEMNRLVNVILAEDVTGKAAAAGGSNSAPGLYTSGDASSDASSDVSRDPALGSPGQSGDWRSRGAATRLA